jgi:hypothetical protein
VDSLQPSEARSAARGEVSEPEAAQRADEQPAEIDLSGLAEPWGVLRGVVVAVPAFADGQPRE